VGPKWESRGAGGLLLINWTLGKRLFVLIQRYQITKEEGPGFFRGVQTRDRRIGWAGVNSFIPRARLLAGLPGGKAGITLGT
jgi:hypothetical protein